MMHFLLGQAPAAEIVQPAVEDLTLSGWIVLVVCVGMVCLLAGYCYYKILSEPAPSTHHHGPLDIDTQDTD